MRFQILPAFSLVAGAIAQQDLINTLNSSSDLSTLFNAINLVPGLAAALNASSNITIFAPTNSAFNNLSNDDPVSQAVANEDANAVAAVLAYHVAMGKYPASAAAEVPTFVHTLLNDTYEVQGAALTNVTGGQNIGLILNGKNVQVLSGELTVSTVTEADIRVGGIIIHKIDKLLKLPVSPAITAVSAGLSAVTGALSRANLVTTIDTATDLTLFVPTNEAFQMVGSAFKNASMETLQTTLSYHAVQGSVVFSPDVTNTTVSTLADEDVTLSVINGTIFVNYAKVVIPNIILSNGVAHVIDGVLNPMNTSVNRNSLLPSASPSPAFSSASSGSVVPFASSAPSASTTISVPAVATTAQAAGSTTAGGNGNNNNGGGMSSTSNAATVPTARAGQAVMAMGAVLGGALVF